MFATALLVCKAAFCACGLVPLGRACSRMMSIIAWIERQRNGCGFMLFDGNRAVALGHGAISQARARAWLKSDGIGYRV